MRKHLKKTTKKILLLATILVFSVFCAIGCAKDNKKTEEKKNIASNTNVDNENDNDQDEEVLEDYSSDTEDEEFEKEKTAENSLEIYTIDTEALEIAPVSVSIQEQKITAETIVKTVADNLEEKIAISKVVAKGKDVIVVFDSKGAPVKGCSAQIESLILECIANSILDNLESCRNVIFQTDKGAYESGHISMELNEVYASK